MRTHVLFLLTLLILAACSSPAATQIFATEKPAVTAPAPTQESTKAPTPEPTKKPSFVEVFPPTIQRCKAENDVPVADMDQALEKIIAMEEALGIAPKDAGVFHAYFSNFEQSISKSPNITAFNIHRGMPGNETYKPSSCFHLTFPDGGEAYVIGVPVLYAQKSTDVVFVHFAVDPAAMEKLYLEYDRQGLNYGWKAYQKYIDLDFIYDNLRNGNFYNFTALTIIQDPVGGCADYWKNMLYLRDLAQKKGVAELGIKANKWTKLSAAERANLKYQLERIIRPTTSIFAVPEGE